MSHREALAWRTLRACAGYDAGPVDPGLRDVIVQRPGGGHTPVVGAYAGELLVCEDALCWPGAFMPYDEIASVSRDLQVVLHDGRTFDPPVSERDVPAFRSFLETVRPR